MPFPTPTPTPPTATYLTTNQYILNFVAVELAIFWYAAFSLRFVSRVVRAFVKHGVQGFFAAINQTEVEKKSASESAEQKTTWQFPSVSVWARMALCTSFLLGPFFLVTIPQINVLPGYSAGDWLFDTISMSWFMFVPTFFITIRFPNRNYLDIVNDLFFIGSLWLPWQLGWLPSSTCHLTPDTSFPISHIVILNLVIYLVHIPSRLHHRLGFNFAALIQLDHWLAALIGLFYCFIVVIPFGIFTGFLVSSIDPHALLFDYLSDLGFEYFLYSMIIEIFFRGIIQNLIEFHLNKRGGSSTSSQKDDISHLHAFSPLAETTMEGDFLTDLEDFPEASPSTTRKIFDYLKLPRNASIALFTASLLNALPFLAVPYGEKHQPPNFLYFVIVFLSALAYGWVWRKTSRVTMSSLTHALFNAFWFALFCCVKTPKK
jgi:hypothetical protein